MTTPPAASGTNKGKPGGSGGQPTPLSMPVTEPAGVAHPKVIAAVAELSEVLPSLPLSEHPRRYAAVLETLQDVLDGTRE